MLKVLAGAALVAGVYYGLKYLSEHSGHTPAPHDPPPPETHLTADGGAP